ncbi:hypothetical protein [Agromyces sp. Leaf222]|uniref:hypothetical protein n=1 Tax=Agromyces sp. Leaf222 TaxID=1735688 RepID=UPI0006F55A54|nr:hypothetical protein [Agromyces sp. Leaf222]KQM81405.1 hypothetical protein ASE68_16695 [Agromyces sp. Leaf222]
MRLSPLPEPDDAADTAEAEAAAGGEPEALTEAAATAEAEAAAGAAPHPDGSYDAALVLVHGMGEAFRSQILLEWAEPILARMDWMTRERIYGADDTYGVQLDASDLSGDAPIVSATVKFPKRRDPNGPADAPVEPVTKRIAIIEARWAESFVPLGTAQIFRWAAPFMWRAIIRMLRLFWATMVLLPWYTLIEHPRVERKRLALRSYVLTFLFDLVRLIVGFAVFLPVAAFVFLLAVVLTPVLPLISPLLLIPAFKKAAGDVIQGLAGSIGDVTAWKETPVRASAMRLVVRDAVARAKSLVGDGDVHVFAHSQGAAVSTFTLFEEMDPHAFNVRQLTTVGAAVSLLGREKWRGRTDPYTPVQNWIDRRSGQDRPVEWANHWAIWDPFSAGPIADKTGKARQRWRASYFPRRAGDAFGPEEHAVHNVSQPFLDHSYYYKNTLQVVEPTVRNLLGPELPGPSREVAYIENRLNVINKKSLGTNMIAAVVIAVLLPGLTAVSAFLASAVTTVAGWFASIGDVFNGADAAPDVASSVGFLHEAGHLTGWGWVIASALVAALLIWINQVITGYVERTLIWDRCPLPVGWWLALTSVPRLVYVVGAAVVVWFSVEQWAPVAPEWRIWLGAAFVVVAAFAFLEARFAPAPVVVPARTRAEEIAILQTGEAAPLSLRLARRSDAYRDNLKARQKALDPQGWWAKMWARSFHHWPQQDEQPEVGPAPSAGVPTRA